MAITPGDIAALESRINDRLLRYQTRFELSVHFVAERLNDSRNIPPIEIGELDSIFERLLVDETIAAIVALNDGDSFNIRCSSSDINMPCGVKKFTRHNASVTQKNIVITIMRKKLFKPKDPIEFIV